MAAADLHYTTEQLLDRVPAGGQGPAEEHLAAFAELLAGAPARGVDLVWTHIGQHLPE